MNSGQTFSNGDWEDADDISLVDLVAQSVMDRLEEQKHLDAFLDAVIEKVTIWSNEEKFVKSR